MIFFATSFIFRIYTLGLIPATSLYLIWPNPPINTYLFSKGMNQTSFSNLKKINKTKENKREREREEEKYLICPSRVFSLSIQTPGLQIFYGDCQAYSSSTETPFSWPTETS